MTIKNTKWKLEIRIPKASKGEIFKVDKWHFWTLEKVEKWFNDLRNLLIGVVVAVVVSWIASLIAVIGIFIDQVRYNNAAYREYSQKIESIENLKEQNKKLFEENQKNQNIIVEQQKILIDSLQRK